MLSAADRLKAELSEDSAPKAKAKPANSNGDSKLFALANAVPIAEVLAWLCQLEGERPRCPGCGESDSGVAIVANGLKCSHDRCQGKGAPVNGATRGFRTPVDLVMEVKSLDNVEAARAICERFHIDVPRAKGGDPGEPPPGRFEDEAPPAAQRRALEIIESAAIFAELEEPDYLIDGVIRRASVNEIVAYGQSGKTWFGVNALLSVAAGVPWLGRFACKPGKVLFVDYESGVYESRRRLKANATALGFASVDGVGLISMPSVYMNSPKFEAVMLEACAGRDLVLIDSLKAANPGVDENDSNMRTGLDVLRRVGEKTGCAFLVLVHAKKTSASVNAIDPREAGRGSSAIFDAADVVLHVLYRENQPLLVQQTKARLGRPVEAFQVVISDVADGVAVVGSDVPTAEAPSDKFEAVCTKVLETVRAWPGESANEIRERLHIRITSVTAALKHLERHGAVKNTGGKKDPAWFPTGAPARDEWADFATE